MDEIVLLSTGGRSGRTERGFSYDAVASQLGAPKSVFMFVAEIQPGETIPAHMHPAGTETIVYIQSGEVEHRYGDGLAKSMVNRAGDFIFIPGNVPHRPINLSASEPVRAIVACNFDLNVEGHSIPYPGGG